MNYGPNYKLTRFTCCGCGAHHWTLAERSAWDVICPSCRGIAIKEGGTCKQCYHNRDCNRVAVVV